MLTLSADDINAIAEAVVIRMQRIEERILDSDYEMQHLPRDERKRRKRQMMLAENKERKARQEAG